MRCKGCGMELMDSATFCPYCGTKNELATTIDEFKREETVNEVEDKKVWKVFSKLSLIFGYICIVSSGIGLLTSFNLYSGVFGMLLSTIALELGTPGIVFGVLGKKSPSAKANAKKGLVLNIIAVSIAFFACIVYGVVVGIAGYENSTSDYNNYLNFFEFFVR